MTSIIALIVITLLSLLAVRIGSTALMMTGLSWDTASFQAYSAFFGVGFTTREAEMVVNHPVRRRIIRDLILAGNLGLTSAVAALVVTMVQSKEEQYAVLVIAEVVLGLLTVLYLAGRPCVQRPLDKLIQYTLKRAGLVACAGLRTAAAHPKRLLRERGGDHGGLTHRGQNPARDAAMGFAAPSSWPSSGMGRPSLAFPGPTEQLLAGDLVTVYGEESSIKGLF